MLRIFGSEIQKPSKFTSAMKMIFLESAQEKVEEGKRDARGPERLLTPKNPMNASGLKRQETPTAIDQTTSTSAEQFLSLAGKLEFNGSAIEDILVQCFLSVTLIVKCSEVLV